MNAGYKFHHDASLFHDYAQRAFLPMVRPALSICTRRRSVPLRKAACIDLIITFRADSQATAVSLSAWTPSSFRRPPDNNGIRLCASASYDDLHCHQKSRVTPREQCLFSSCTLIHAVRNTIFKVQQTEYRLVIPLTHRLNHHCLSGSRNLQATRRMVRFLTHNPSGCIKAANAETD